MSSVNLSYKELHEAFMTNHNGTTSFENFILISSGPLLVFFTCCLYHFLALTCLVNTKLKNILIFLLDFSIIILPLILNFTVFTDYPWTFLIFLFSIYSGLILCLFTFIQRVNFKTDYLSKNQNKPFITYFRAIVNIITAVCILAVDFNIFPRRLAKTENFGYGLMDTGVGFYIVTNGIVVKNKQVNIKKGTYLFKIFVNTIPLLLLGAVRFFTVTAIDYQSHTSEYGVHWNFFITLAGVKLISSIIILYLNEKSFLLTLILPVLHQYFLSLGLQEWAMKTLARDNFFTANREGFISLLGYLSLYFASLELGKILKRINTKKDRVKYLIIFVSILCVLINLMQLSEYYFPSSRRFANITYNLWMLSLSIYIIVICFIIELSLDLFYCVLAPDKFTFTPTILEAINYNGLTFFLVSNLLTGLVNICFQTLYVDDVMSVVIITCYMISSCLITYVLFISKIQLKWW